MPFSRPTLTALRDGVLQDISAAQVASASGTLLAGLLQKAVLRVVAYAQAGLSYEHYGYLDYIARQAVPWTATAEFLEAWAALKGVIRKSATGAIGTATFAGVDGQSIPAGTQVARSDDFAYLTVGAVTVAAGTVTAAIAATIAGVAGNFDTNTTFLLANPVDGIASQSTASAQTIAGADAELDDALRTRMLLEYAAPPQGGDRTDYIEWALAVAGVTRAWIAPNGFGAGTVVVYVMLDLAEVAHDGFPQGTDGVSAGEPRDAAATGDQLTVANAILPQQPVTALVYVCAPIAQTVSFTINNLGSNNTTAMHAAITAALTDMFLRLANVGGTSDPDTGAAWPALDPSAWYAALEAIPGLTNFTVAIPSGPVSPSAGHLLTLGSVTFNA